MEMWTLCLTFPSLGDDNIASTDGLWVIWASLLVSIHREIIVDYFHANWHEWDESIYIKTLLYSVFLVDLEVRLNFHNSNLKKNVHTTTRGSNNGFKKKIPCFSFM